jgi:3-deoxy-D-manno-octulosonate 8-phosphate phosphatase (KDO 8-P phosphatase)
LLNDFQVGPPARLFYYLQPGTGHNMDIHKLFTEAGGEFQIPFEAFSTRLKAIRAIIFDWDGVFNDGTKDHQGSSNFNEVDAMGTNLVRFSRWLAQGKLPIVAVMSGERNTLSFQLTSREHFHQGYFRVKDKMQAFRHFAKLHDLNPKEIAFVFDDVLDLALAEEAGLRIMVQHGGSPLFKNFVLGRKLADYVTSRSPFAVREACELIIGTTGNYDEVVDSRSHFTDRYKEYLAERQAVSTEYYTVHEDEMRRAEI